MKYTLHYENKVSGVGFQRPLEIVKNNSKAKKDVKILDIGFFKGAFTKAALDTLQGFNLRIYAFEANPENVRVYSSAFDSIEEVVIFQKAIGSSPGFFNLHVHKSSILDNGTSYGGLLIGNNEVRPSMEGPDFLKVPVETICISDFLRGYDFIPDLIKIDVQGGGLNVLKGVGDSIYNVPVIFCEVQLLELQDKSLIQYLESHGFDIYIDTFQFGLKQEEVGAQEIKDFLKNIGLELIAEYGLGCIYARLIEPRSCFTEYGLVKDRTNDVFTYFQADIIALNINMYPSLSV